MFTKLVKSFWKTGQRYPYDSFATKPLLAQYLFLFALPNTAFPSMSIVPAVKRHYKLASDEEFRTRYYTSRIGFEELWNARARNAREDVEYFYQEHDKDIWRQAYLSQGDYNYKKKILKTSHMISREHLSPTDPILDYGGGAGVLVQYLARKGFRAVDIADIPSQTLTFVAKQMSPLLRRIITVDGSEDLGENTYAVITTLDCLEHTFEPLAITKRLLRALRPRGLLIVSFPRETDFSNTHIPQAQEQRDAVFELLHQTCDVIVQQLVYRKRLA